MSPFSYLSTDNGNGVFAMSCFLAAQILWILKTLASRTDFFYNKKEVMNERRDEYAFSQEH